MIIKFKSITAINNIADGERGSLSYVFHISETPISNDQYCEYLNELPAFKKTFFHKKWHYTEIVYKNDHFQPKSKLLGHFPITNITYHDAINFCTWLNQKDSSHIYNLPTIDEWYKAAYYNPIEKKYYNFPNQSDNIPEETLSKDPTNKIGMNTNNIFSSKIKNKYFIFNNSYFDVRDMAGNVYEMLYYSTGYKCYLAGSSWNRHLLNAHKYYCGNKTIFKHYSSNYIGFRICKTAKRTPFYVSLHNDFGDGWKDDYINIYDTNLGTIINNLSLHHGYDSELIPLHLFNITDNYIIIEYISKDNISYENHIKIFDRHRQLINTYNFIPSNRKKIVQIANS